MTECFCSLGREGSSRITEETLVEYGYGRDEVAGEELNQKMQRFITEVVIALVIFCTNIQP